MRYIEKFLIICFYAIIFLIAIPIAFVSIFLEKKSGV